MQVWWNESRWSKLRNESHLDGEGWLSSVERVKELPQRQLALVAARAGLAGIKPEYLSPSDMPVGVAPGPATKQCSRRWIHGRTRLKTFLSAVEMAQQALRMKREDFWSLQVAPKYVSFTSEFPEVNEAQFFWACEQWIQSSGAKDFLAFRHGTS